VGQLRRAAAGSGRAADRPGGLKPRERSATRGAGSSTGVKRRRDSSGAAPPPPTPLDPDDERLFQALRAWRLATARAKGVSPFIVAEDVLLQRIAVIRPTSPEALERVPGIGPKRLDAYGAAIIELVREG
jgi:superfamily II DNA helicase RecQ